MTTKKPKGLILYDGPSMLDGKPIVAIATGFQRSHNRKTGRMLQVWIIRKGINPIKAIYRNDNFSVCGNCKHRPNTDKNPTGWNTCYVNVGQAPLAVYNTYKKGNYRKIKDSDYSLFANWGIRFGAYGDPAAVPIEVWEKIIANCWRHTGYTHQWKTCDQKLSSILMASVDNEKEMEKAHSMGWRTFRVRTPEENLKKNERVCPAGPESGLNGITCKDCMTCRGGSNTMASIAIVAHGSWKATRFIQIRVKQNQKKAYIPLLAVSEKTKAMRTQ